MKKNKLSPFDYEMIGSVERLTGNIVKIEEAEEVKLTVTCKEKDEVKQAIKDMLKGRLGKARKPVVEDLSNEQFTVVFQYSQTDYPEMKMVEFTEVDKTAGASYERVPEEVRAIQVTKANFNELAAFTGGGTEMDNEDGTITYSFLNENNVYLDAKEFSFITRDCEGCFRIIEKQDFIRDYKKQ